MKNEHANDFSSSRRMDQYQSIDTEKENAEIEQSHQIIVDV